MKDHPFILLLVRFGLPLVVGVHYITAAGGLSYTPDGAFGGAHAGSLLAQGWVGGGIAENYFSPLWTLLLAAGKAMRLDPLLVAKVLGLVFSSCGVIALYLLAVEILGDRLLAFLVSLVSGLDPGLLLLAPAGMPWGLLFALLYALLFTLRRGEFAIGGIIVGFAGLVAWPAAGLLIVLAIEAFRGGETDHPLQTAIAGGLVAGAVWGTWALVGGSQGWPITPGGSIPGDAPGGWWVMILPAAGVACGVAGWRRTRAFPLLRLVYPGDRTLLVVAMGWVTACGLLFTSSYFHLLGPLALLLAMDGIRRIVPSMYREPISYAPALFVAGGVLVLHQLIFFTSTKPEMDQEVLRQGELESIAVWGNGHLPGGATVRTERPGTLAYLLLPGITIVRREDDLTARFIVTAGSPGTAYERIYRPAGTDGGKGSEFAVYRHLGTEGSP